MNSGKIRLQWLIGDWKSLSANRVDQIEGSDDRCQLIQMIIAGCLQVGSLDQATQLIRLSLDWGCDRGEIARTMLAMLHVQVGRAKLLLHQETEALEQFRLSIALPPGGIESDVLAQARLDFQRKLLEQHADAPQHGGTCASRPASGIRSYAQNFEDVMLWRALGFVEQGAYIDIGAQDPVYDSVSLGFYEKGWRGVHIEPTASYAEALRLARPDETVIEAAVSTCAGEANFYEVPGTGISTGIPSIAAEHIARGFSSTMIRVKTVTLASVLDEYFRDRPVHWMKIDVEGMELQVLESWGDCEVRPWIVVVESTLPLMETQSHFLWDRELTRRDYYFKYFDGLNRFYLHIAHPELDAQFAAPPNVFDNYTLRRVSIF